MEVEVGASSRVLELEERASALQKEKKDLDASLASVRIRAETSIKQLEEARDRAQAAEDAAKTAEELVGVFRQAIADEALGTFRHRCPQMTGEDANSVELIELFRWLRCCVAMTDCGSQFFGELNAGVAVRSLIAAVCSLIKAPDGGKAIFSKTKLRTLRDPSMQWHSADELKPEALGALPRNITKNFMATFFQEKGRELVAHEGARMKSQVGPLFVRCCLRLFPISADIRYI